MIRQLDLDFCILIYSDEDSYINLEKEMVIRAYSFNKEFAKISIPKFKIQLVYSREEFNRLWGFETQKFVSAFVKDTNLVIFSYKVFDKETKWRKKEFYNTLIHEINHLFYQDLRHDPYEPLWLSEGLATFMQHIKKKTNYKNKLKITKKLLEQTFEEINLESYQVFTMFVEYLILSFGEDKILELISELKKGTELNRVFQKIYKMSFEELIKDGNRYQKIT
jgi:hypothetical protein